MAEEVIIYQLRDRESNNIAGLTPEEAVYDTEGIRLNTKLTNIESEITKLNNNPLILDGGRADSVYTLGLAIDCGNA